MSRHYSIAFLIALLAACSDDNTKLRLQVSTEEPAPSIALAIAELFNKEGYEITIESNADPRNIVAAIANGESDLAIIEEPETYTSGAFTVLPLYPSILHVLHRKGEMPDNFAELIRNKSIYTGPIGGMAQRLLERLADSAGVKATEYKVLDVPWLEDPDIYFMFGGLLSKESLDNLRSYQLFSFGDARSLGSGTPAEGIALKMPNVRPFILPEQIYGDVSAKPILTLATRSILIGSAGLDSTTVYDINTKLAEKPQTLAAQYPLILEELGKSFEPKRLALPLHEGSSRYLNRALPSIVERHADVLSLLLAALLSLGSGLFGLFQYRQNVKKDRIDLYINKIIELRRKIADIDGDEMRQEIFQEVKDVQEEVMLKVMDEKIDSDLSLTMFINVSNQVLAETKL